MPATPTKAALSGKKVHSLPANATQEFKNLIFFLKKPTDWKGLNPRRLKDPSYIGYW